MAKSHAYEFDKRKLPMHVRNARARVHRELTSLIDSVMSTENKRIGDELAAKVEKEVRRGLVVTRGRR